MLEENKKMDESQQHMEYQQKLVETGEETKYAYDKICDIENSTRERVHGFIERAPKYDGNPETMFEQFHISQEQKRDNTIFSTGSNI